MLWVAAAAAGTSIDALSCLTLLDVHGCRNKSIAHVSLLTKFETRNCPLGKCCPLVVLVVDSESALLLLYLIAQVAFVF